MSKIILEIDSTTVKTKLESMDLDRSANGPLVENIKRSLDLVWQQRVFLKLKYINIIVF
jgi:hypothetical protein